MNLPNKITISRIMLIPAFLIFIIPLPEWTNKYAVLEAINNFIIKNGNTIAFAIFALASLTDGIDGYIARKYNQVTNLGIFLDPIADKIMIISALIALVQRNSISVWVSIIIIAREFIVTGFRLIASDKKLVISANKWGKFKTITQIILIMTALSTKNNTVLTMWSIITIIVTVYSGWKYIYENKSILE